MTQPRAQAPRVAERDSGADGFPDRLLSAGQWPGTVLTSRQLGDLRACETAYRAEAHLEVHAHTRPYLCLVLAGSYTEVGTRAPRACGPGDLLFHPGGSEHADHFHRQGGRCFNVECTDEWLAETAAHLPTAPVHRIGCGANGLGHQVYSTFLEDSDALEELAVALIGDLLGAPPPTRRPPPWLARVQELLHEERTGNLRLMTAARAVGVHPVHLARVFRQWYGCSFTDQVLQMRLAGAARALSTSDAPLAWIAAEYGFADQSHLCRTFRTHVGLTPAAYRRAFRG